MSEELICPDCGGVIGGEPGQGRQVCKCFEPRRGVATLASGSGGSVAGLADDPSASAAVAPAAGEKPCRVCGRDLKGHRRLKDSRGYVCVECDAAERRGDTPAGRDAADLVPCPECGRKLKVDGLVTYQGTMMCKKCATDAKELHKYKAPPPGLVTHKEHEKASLQKLLLFAGVLVVIMAAAYFGLIGRH